MVDEPLERDLEKHFTKECRRLDLLNLKLRIMGKRGWPDRLVTHNTKCHLAELKTLKGKLSPLQEVTFAKLSARGINVQVLRTKEQITQYLTGIKNDKAPVP